MKKPRTKKDRSLPVRRVDKSPEVEAERHDWTLPTKQSIALDKARHAHWWAVLNGGDTVATLKAWADLLHVPRTRAKA